MATRAIDSLMRTIGVPYKTSDLYSHLHHLHHHTTVVKTFSSGQKLRDTLTSHGFDRYGGSKIASVPINDDDDDPQVARIRVPGGRQLDG